MTHFTLGYRLPRFFSNRLFGDRERFGLVVQPDDPCWIEYNKVLQDYYLATQKKSIGNSVNNAGYKVLRKINIEGKKVLEVGPGQISHIKYWTGMPAEYTIVDIRQEMLDQSAKALQKARVKYSTRLIPERTPLLPFEDESFDLVISFYSLEHLYPLPDYLREICRVVRPQGTLTGAIPCEGGVAWGLGRYMSSRRWFLNHTNVNPDKIICWEHPNWADYILESVGKLFQKNFIRFWPSIVPSIDLNLLVQFIYEKK
jgi:ubiquinone/menaquinone biosynthesis C-methylase UbiE